MKKIVIAFVFVLFAASASYAQRFAYVDSDYILKHVPEYVSAQKQLDDLSVQWQQEVDSKYGDIEKLYKQYSEHHYCSFNQIFHSFHFNL